MHLRTAERWEISPGQCECTEQLFSRRPGGWAGLRGCSLLCARRSVSKQPLAETRLCLWAAGHRVGVEAGVRTGGAARLVEGYCGQSSRVSSEWEWGAAQSRKKLQTPGVGDGGFAIFAVDLS